MKSVILRPHPASEPKGEPVNSPVWRNLYFLKKGGTDFGSEIFLSESQANAKAEIFFKLLQANPTAYVEWGKTYIAGKEISHALQIPGSLE